MTIAEALDMRDANAIADIPTDPVADFEGAAHIYQSCRSAGITPRGLIDCLIATITIRSGSTLLTADQDFQKMATIVPLQLAR